MSALRISTVEFLSPQQHLLVGTLTDPADDDDESAGTSAPVVMLVHGYMSCRNSELLVRLATALARTCRIASFRFDLEGNGDSKGEFRYGRYRYECEQLRCAKQHLEQQLGRRVVAMVGHSKGGTDVLLYAGRYDDLACLVNLAGRFELQQGVLERLGPHVLTQLEREGQVEMTGRSQRGPFTWQLRQEDLQDRLTTDMAAACSGIHNTPVLTIHGSADADVPVGQAAKFDKHIARHKLLVLDGADHCFSSGPAMYELAAAVLSFISQHVQQADTAVGDKK